MKKIFVILAAIAMVCTVSCKKDDNKKDKKEDTATTSTNGKLPVLPLQLFPKVLRTTPTCWS